MTNQTATPTANPTNNQPTNTRPPRPAMPTIAGVQRANVAPSNAPRTASAPPTKRISDRDDFMRAIWLPPNGKVKIIRAWGTNLVYSQDEKKRVPMPMIVFTDGKKMNVNSTQLQCLSLMFNDDELASIGKPIMLKPGKALNGKDTIIISRASAPSVNTTTGELKKEDKPTEPTLDGEPIGDFPFEDDEPANE